MLTNIPAILWEDEVRLEGVIFLEQDQLRFQHTSPKRSGLNLVIAKGDIETIQDFLLFDIERKGIEIASRNGRKDRFIVENPRQIKKIIQEWSDS